MTWVVDLPGADPRVSSASNKVFSYDPNKLPVDPIQGPLL